MRSAPDPCQADEVGLSCLIVDDNSAFLDAAATLLEREGLTVSGTALTGDEAVRLTRELDPDVVLVDINLGAESGLELTHRLVGTDSRPTVILISTHAYSDYADLIGETPAAGFVPKAELSASAIAKLVSEPRGT